MYEAVLLDNKFAPTTSRIGFIQGSMEAVAEGLYVWRVDLYGRAKMIKLSGCLEQNIRSLEPLTLAMRPRELLVATSNPEWTAYFDCLAPFPDPVSSVGYLSQTLKLNGVVVISVPELEREQCGPYGSRQLQMFGPHKTDFINYIRTISVVQDGSKWRFDANGAVQDFEDIDAYSRRRIKERFTSEMLVNYSRAIGLEPFDADFYSNSGVLITSPVTHNHRTINGRRTEMSIAEAQQYYVR